MNSAQFKIKQAFNTIFGIVLVFILGLTLLVWGGPHQASNKMMSEAFWANKLVNAPVYDIVVVGDSRVYRGINPQIIEQQFKSKVRCFNFGFSSAGLDTILLNEACKKLKSSGMKTLLIGVSVNSFYPHALKNQHFKEWQHKPKKELWIKRHLYPHLSQLSPYALSDLYHLGTNNQYFEFFKPQSGFVYSCKLPIDTNSAIQPYRQYFERTQCSDLAVNLFMNKLAQMKLQGYNIVLLRVPASYTMWNMEDEFSGNVINELELKTSQLGINWIQTTPSKHTYDGSHLIDKSTNQFSQYVAKELISNLSK
jgi:hypothetical protein